MDRDKYLRVFGWKISRELKLFKYRMLQKNKEEMFSLAYQIDKVVTIYEILLEMGQRLETDMLKQCIQVPNLLTFLFEKWMQVPDSQNCELELAIIQVMEELTKKAA